MSASFCSLASPDDGAAHTIGDRGRAGKRQCAELPPLARLAVECRALPSRPPTLQFRSSRLATTASHQESAMGERFPGVPPSARPPEDRLDSWKEIATYLNR